MADPIRKKPRGKQPISRHALFPAIVALWSGALLALAGLALVPAGTAATRIAAALAMAAIGGAIGLIVARRIAVPKEVLTPAPKAPAETDGDPLWSDLKTRSRELGDSEPEVPAEVTAPLLDREPEILDVADVVPPVAFDTPEPAGAPAQSSAADRLTQADLDDLSYVELLERLALSMQRRDRLRRSLDAAPLAAALQRHLPATEPQAPPEPPAAEETPVVFPAAERRHAPAVSVDTSVARPFDAPADAAAAVQDDPRQTERALRDALAALQRISGAA